MNTCPGAMVVCFVSVVSSSTFLAVLGYHDLKSREIPDSLVYAYLATSLATFVAAVVSMLNCYPPVLISLYPAFSAALTSALMYVLYRGSYMGEGDFYVTLSTGLAHAYPATYICTLQGRGVLPPGLLIVLYASLGVVLYAVSTAIVNLVKYRKHVCELPGIYKILVPFIAKPIKLEDIEIRKQRCVYTYPVEFFEVADGTIKRRFKLSTRLEGVDNLETTIKLLRLAGRDYVWATTGQPFVLYMLLGLVVFIVLGDTPIVALFTHLLQLY